jgi:hypothetical protein
MLRSQRHRSLLLSRRPRPSALLRRAARWSRHDPRERLLQLCLHHSSLTPPRNGPAKAHRLPHLLALRPPPPRPSPNRPIRLDTRYTRPQVDLGHPLDQLALYRPARDPSETLAAAKALRTAIYRSVSEQERAGKRDTDGGTSAAGHGRCQGVARRRPRSGLGSVGEGRGLGRHGHDHDGERRASVVRVRVGDSMGLLRCV